MSLAIAIAVCQDSRSYVIYFTEVVVEQQESLVNPIRIITPLPIPPMNHASASPIFLEDLTDNTLPKLPPISRSPSRSALLESVKENELLLKKSQELLIGL